LHFPGQDAKPLQLQPGSYGIGWRGGRLGVVTEQADALLNLRVDGRDFWLHVAPGTTACVHINGRRVYQIARLRYGDVIHVDAAELRLIAEPSPLPAAQTQASNRTTPDPGWVLRGLSGQHHGQCFSLDRPRWMGRSGRADIQIDEPSCAERCLRLERIGEQVIMCALGTSECLVNGQPVRDAVLAAGDQLVLSPRHRFVLEAPQINPPASSPADAINTEAPRLSAPRSRPSSYLWLLAAAALIAAALSGLLLYGTAS